MGTRARHTATADQTFAANLVIARDARRLSLRGLGNLLRDTETPILPSGLCLIENGYRTVSVGEAVSLCQVLDIPLETMLRGPLAAQVDVTWA